MSCAIILQSFHGDRDGERALQRIIGWNSSAVAFQGLGRLRGLGIVKRAYASTQDGGVWPSGVGGRRKGPLAALGDW